MGYKIFLLMITFVFCVSTLALNSGVHSQQDYQNFDQKISSTFTDLNSIAPSPSLHSKRPVLNNTKEKYIDQEVLVLTQVLFYVPGKQFVRQIEELPHIKQCLTPVKFQSSYLL